MREASSAPYEVANLKANFDLLLAIDSNSIEIEGCRFGVTLAYAVDDVLSNCGDEVRFSAIGAYLFNINAPAAEQSSFERFGWWLIIENLLDPQKLKHWRVGVVVDAYLGDLDYINRKAAPYFDGEFIPDDFQLIYASADKSDGLCAKMIKQCDRVATSALAAFRERGDYELKGAERLGPYTWRRIEGRDPAPRK